MTRGTWPERILLLATGGLLLLFSLWLSFVSQPVAAGETSTGQFNAFGPENFVRGFGSPVIEERTFTVLNPNTQYALRIDNGGVNGEFTRVSSATVSLNGVQIVGPNQFNHTVSLIVRPVTLSAINELAVELRSKPGSGFTLRVIGTDNDPPTITASVSPPANKAGWHNVDPTVSFECSDATSGIASCTDPVLVDTEGADQVVIGTAIDNAGNSSSVSVTLHVDKTPPLLSDFLPSDGDNLPDTEVNLTGMVADPLSGVQAVNCHTGSTTADAVVNDAGDVPVFACSLPLVVGPNLIQVQATDIAGNSTSSTLTIHRVQPPEINIQSPSELELVPISPVTVTGTVDGPGASVTVNGVQASVSNGQFTASVPLPPGFQTITAVAKNAAGSESDEVRVLVIIGTAPTVAVDTPSNNFVLGRRNDGSLTVTVNGWVRDNRLILQGQPDVTVHFNGSAVEATVTDETSGPCLAPRRCWRYTAQREFPSPTGVNLSIDVEAQTGKVSASRQISGIVDFCEACSGENCGTLGASLFQGHQQSRRCIIISDGCSGPFGDNSNNDPTDGDLMYPGTSTAFGKDEDANEGADTVFGQPRPIQLPCNRHDECYLQWCPQTQTRSGVVAAQRSCNLRFFNDMKAVCQRAYPETVCPAGRIGQANCAQWRAEKSRCYGWARRYYSAVGANTQRFFDRITYYIRPYVNPLHLGEEPRYVQCVGCPDVE